MTTSVTAGLCAAAQTENIVRQLLERIRRHSGPGDPLREEINAVVAGCLDLVAGEAMAPSARMERIHRAAARWAGVGVPIETVHRLVREGFRLHLDTHLDDRQSPPLRRNQIDRLIGAQNAVNATMARAYLEVAPSTGPAQQREVARALFGGRPPDRVSLEYGVPLTQCNTVLAVAATDARGARAMGAFAGVARETVRLSSAGLAQRVRWHNLGPGHDRGRRGGAVHVPDSGATDRVGGPGRPPRRYPPSRRPRTTCSMWLAGFMAAPGSTRSRIWPWNTSSPGRARPVTAWPPCWTRARAPGTLADSACTHQHRSQSSTQRAGHVRPREHRGLPATPDRHADRAELHSCDRGVALACGPDRTQLSTPVLDGAVFEPQRAASSDNTALRS